MKHTNVLIDKLTFDFASHKRDALSKARLDVNRTFESLDAKVLTINIQVGRKRILGILNNIWQYIKCMCRIPYQSNIYIQYPALSSRLSYYNILIMYAHVLRCKVIYIIHDIEVLRFKVHSDKDEVRVLNTPDVLIVHSESMKQKLEEFGVVKPMVVLKLFDYYCTNDRKNNDAQLCCVAFAGNLSKYKSKFIAKLISMKHKYVWYRFYGVPNELEFDISTNSEYCGSFAPECVCELNASWGLVWDGDELDSCSGIGQYLRYNSSHKLSLYIAAGLPLIVWSESSIADYVKKEYIGICVDSLLDLDEVLSNVLLEEYTIMKKNVLRISHRITNGEMLKEAINECEEIINRM